MSVEAKPNMLFVTICSVWPFLFDTVLTFFRRLVRRENVLQAHRSHLYQRLVQCGMSHAMVVTLYAAGSAIASTLAIASLRSAAFAVATLIAIPAMAAALAVLVSMRESEGPVGPKTSNGRVPTAH
jgi:Fuc2NAc and GlcNAc transferase